MLIEALFNSDGAYGQVTGEGRLYVEKKEGKTGEISEHPERFYISVVGNNNQIALAANGSEIAQTSGLGEGHGLAGTLVENIERKIKEDNAITEEQKKDASSYLAVVRRQLRKEEPDRTILAAVLEPLSKFVSIAGQVASLIKLING